MNNTNQKGVTLIELLASIVVGSIVIMMLMSLLILSVKARTDLEIDNRMKNESYFLTEQIRVNAFRLETQTVEIDTVGTQTIITFRHDYDITVDINGSLGPDYVYEFERLIYDSSTGTITYGPSGSETALHGSSVSFLPPGDPLLTGTGLTGTSINVTSLDPTCVPTITNCEDVVITITLVILVDFASGTLAPKEFVTTIVI